MFKPSKTARTLCAAYLSTFMATSGRAAEPASVGFRGPEWIELGDYTRPVLGHQQFCERNPRDCLSYSGSRALYARLDDYTRALMQRVQRTINERIQPREDRDNYNGLEEHWTYADNGFGDCEDYALEKRRMLIAEGWPAQTLMLAVVRNLNQNGAGHAVLIARTNAGDFVFDNLRDNVVRWDTLHREYEFVKTTDTLHQYAWRAVIDTRNSVTPPTVAAPQ